MELSDRLNGCIAIEKAVASIYDTFMKLFPNEKDFWESLVKDEFEHSSFLKDAESLKVIDYLPSEAQPPLIPFIVKTLEYAQITHKRIMCNPVSLEEALNIALTLEQSMVETYTNELIADSHADNNKSYFRDVEKMIIGERGHISKIKNLMIKKGFLQTS
jgi:rubrerythrin